MRTIAAIVLLAACGASTPTPAAAPTPIAAPLDAPPPLDAGIPADAPAWIFRYNAPGRLETWTLRYHGDLAAIDVESATATIHYFGSAVARARALGRQRSARARVQARAARGRRGMRGQEAGNARRAGLLSPGFQGGDAVRPCPGRRVPAERSVHGVSSTVRTSWIWQRATLKRDAVAPRASARLRCEPRHDLDMAIFRLTRVRCAAATVLPTIAG
jgi:hypothetical protein